MRRVSAGERGTDVSRSALVAMAAPTLSTSSDGGGSLLLRNSSVGRDLRLGALADVGDELGESLGLGDDERTESIFGHQLAEPDPGFQKDPLEAREQRGNEPVTELRLIGEAAIEVGDQRVVIATLDLGERRVDCRGVEGGEALRAS